MKRRNCQTMLTKGTESISAGQRANAIISNSRSNYENAFNIIQTLKDAPASNVREHLSDSIF